MPRPDIKLWRDNTTGLYTSEQGESLSIQDKSITFIDTKGREAIFKAWFNYQGHDNVTGLWDPAPMQYTNGETITPDEYQRMVFVIEQYIIDGDEFHFGGKVTWNGPDEDWEREYLNNIG